MFKILSSRFLLVMMLVAAAAAINVSVFTAAFANGSESNTQFSGNLSGAVVLATNLGTGPALEGVQTQSNILTGVIYGAATSTSLVSIAVHGKAFGPKSRGVWGESTTSSNPDAFNPPVGVLGTAVDGVGMGVWGKTTSSIGVGNRPGILGTSSSDFGVFGASSNNLGVYGLSFGSAAGVYGQSLSGPGLFAFNTTAGSAALYVSGGPFSTNAATGAPMMIVHYNGNLLTCGGMTTHDIFSIDEKGNVKACGTITASATPLTVRRTTAGSAVVSYAAQQTQPTIEDFGEGRLIGGQGYVRIDPTFAATIDPHAGYHVYLTPKGDSRGLYVSGETLGGFVVRENQGGRSTLAFDYRIVAKPFDTNAPRLPSASTLPQVRSAAPPPRLPTVWNGSRRVN